MNISIVGLKELYLMDKLDENRLDIFTKIIQSSFLKAYMKINYFYNIIFRIKWKFKIWKIFIYLLLCSPFINHVPEFIFFQGMVIEMVFNNEIQIYFSDQFIF
jgi:hypothetical protein